jgi:hypothetical protein
LAKSYIVIDRNYQQVIFSLDQDREEPTEREWHILEFCQASKKNKELNLDIDRNPTRLSESLKKLQKLGYLNRTLNREYMTSEKGKEAMKKKQLIVETIGRPYIPVAAEIPVVESISIRIDDDSHSLAKESIPIGGFLFLDEEHGEKLKQIEEALTHSAAKDQIWQFFHSLGMILGNVYGYKYDLPDFWEERHDWTDQVNRYRHAMDFDATILLKYEGKKAAEGIDWSSYVRSSRMFEKRHQPYMKKLRRAINKTPAFRMAYVTETTVGPDLDSVENSNKRERWWEAPKPAALEEQFVNHVREALSETFPKIPTKNEVRKLLEELENEGTLKILPTYTLRIDPRKLKEKVEACKKYVKHHLND